MTQKSLHTLSNFAWKVLVAFSVLITTAPISFSDTVSFNTNGDFSNQFTQRQGSGDNRFEEADSIGVSGSRAIRRSSTGDETISYTKDEGLGGLLSTASISVRFNYSTNSTGLGGIPLFFGITSNPSFDGSETASAADDFIGAELSQALTGSNNSKLTLVNGVNGARSSAADSAFDSLAPGWYEIEVSIQKVEGMFDLEVALNRMSSNGSTVQESDVITAAISSLDNVDIANAADIYIYLGGTDTLARGLEAIDELEYSGFGTAQPVSAPTNLVANAVSNSQINLTWIDGSDNETGFFIQRRVDGGDWSQIATVSANTGSYENTGLNANTAYSYRVQATNGDLTSSFSNEASATTSQEGVPNTPTNMSAAIVSSNRVDLTWIDTATTENWFRVYRKVGNGEFEDLIDLARDVESHSDTDVSPGNTYTYYISSVNANGFSAASNEASVTISTQSDITPPSNLTAQPQSSAEVLLTWTDNTEEETGYRVERRTDNGSYVTIVNVGENVTSFTDATVMPLTQYTYRVAGSRFEQLSSYSNEATTNTPALVPPLPPAGLKNVGQGLDYIILEWSDRSPNENGFRLERRSGAGGFELLANLDPETTTYTDNQVNELGVFTYRISSYNEAGNSSPSNEVTAQIEFYHPDQLDAIAISSEQIDLSWNDNSFSETNYVVERRTAGGTFATLVTLTANSESYSDTDVSPLSAYTYRVYASDGSTNSDPTNEASASTPNVPVPGSPSNLVASLVDATYIALTWFDNAVNENGFRIERRVGQGGWSELFQLPANTTVFQDSEVGELESFSYRVISFNDGGDSSATNVASVAFPFNGPSNLLAQSSSSSRIDLTWDDNSLVETGYRIERKSGDGAFESLATTEPGTSAYVDDSAEIGVTYSYRIIGLHADGESGPTNEASATTSADSTTPNVPSGLAANAIDFDQIHLTWTDTANNESGFRIESRLGAEGDYKFVGNVSADTTSYTSKNLEPDTQYFYRIASYINGAQSSDFSNEASATTLAIPLPVAPSELLVASETLSTVSLVWSDESNVESGFKIYRRVGDGTFEELGTVNEDVTYFNDNTVEETENYTYRVVAYNLGGESVPSNEVSVGIPFAAPQLLSAGEIAYTEIELNWLDASLVETGFRIERKADDGAWETVGEIGENSVLYVDESPVPATTYSYRVFAVRNGLESDPSNVINVTTPNVPLPGAATNLVIETLSPTSISLNWQDNSDNEIGFRIYRRELEGGVWILLDVVPMDVNLYVDETAIGGVDYAYSVAPFNNAGEEVPVENQFTNPIAGRLINISTRGLVETGDNVMIGSFIVRGDGPKTVLIRGMGPSLEGSINAAVLQNPQLTLVSGVDLDKPIAYNDDWRDTDEAGVISAGLPPAFESESAIVIRLQPGAYSAILSGVDFTTGFGLIEVYEVDYAKNIRVINISTRSFVQKGDERMIGGFIIRGDTPARVFIRVSGPSLQGSIENRLQDPMLELYSGDERIAINDNWQEGSQIGDIIASGIPPGNLAEPAIVAVLEPGSYTAVVGGAGDSSGYGLLEIYDYPE